MKLCIVIDLVDTPTNGSVMTALRFADGLRERGHDVKIIAIGAPEDGVNVKERYITLVTEVSRLNQIKFGKFEEEPIRALFADGVELVHFIFPFQLEKKCMELAREMGIPTTAAFHVQPENVSYNMHIGWSKPFNKFLYTLFREKFYKYFTHIHCPSNFIAGELKKHGYKGKLHVISNGVGEAFRLEGDPKRAQEGRFDILMVGRLTPEKKQSVLVKAVALSKYNDIIHLTLAGNGPKKEALQKLAEKNLKNPVTFAFFSQEQLIAQIRRSDLYVHAAYVEIEAISCIEAFACGLVPVIAQSPKSATPQFALDGRSLFKANDPKDLARKIDYWIEHPEERYEAAKRYAELGETFRLANSVQAAEEMFEEAIRDFNREQTEQINELIETESRT